MRLTEDPSSTLCDRLHNNSSSKQTGNLPSLGPVKSLTNRSKKWRGIRSEYFIMMRYVTFMLNFTCQLGWWLLCVLWKRNGNCNLAVWRSQRNTVMTNYERGIWPKHWNFNVKKNHHNGIILVCVMTKQTKHYSRLNCVLEEVLRSVILLFVVDVFCFLKQICPKFVPFLIAFCGWKEGEKGRERDTVLRRRWDREERQDRTKI